MFVSRGGGYSQRNWVGVCGLLPKTLTLFMAKICDFPYPIYDQNGGKIAKIDTLFMTKRAEKPYPLGPHIPIWPILGSTPPPRGLFKRQF